MPLKNAKQRLSSLTIWSNLQRRLIILILISPLPLWPPILMYTSIHFLWRTMWLEFFRHTNCVILFTAPPSLVVYWRHFFSQSTSVYSALGADFSVLMCYINSRFTLPTYFTISVQAYSTTSRWHFLLLTPSVTSWECCVPHIISSYHMDLLRRPHP